MPRIGEFDLVQLLGEGTFAFTYLARHSVLGDKFQAVIKQEKTQAEPHRTNFLLEAELLARFTHHTLPSLIGYQRSSGDGDMMIMKLMAGDSAEKVLADGAVTDEHMLWMIDRVLEGLDYLHGLHRVIHSDLSPKNVLIDIPRHAAAIIDFGLAVVRPNERSVAKGGTPGFMAPELDQALPPIPQSDLYSVGKLGIYLIGGDAAAGAVPGDTHAEVRDLLAQMTRRDPRRRPSGAVEVRRAIRDLRQRVWKRTACEQRIERRTKR